MFEIQDSQLPGVFLAKVEMVVVPVNQAPSSGFRVPSGPQVVKKGAHGLDPGPCVFPVEVSGSVRRGEPVFESDQRLFKKLSPIKGGRLPPRWRDLVGYHMKFGQKAPHGLARLGCQTGLMPPEETVESQLTLRATGTAEGGVEGAAASHRIGVRNR